ncbi:unnamed protein product, partial [Prorocentrum cordatum]
MAAEALEGAGGALGAEALEGAAEYCRTVLHAKRRIHECLTVLGIMHQRRDQEVAAPGAQRADEMHCAMVMLNSGLLKALHVTDSFHAHCHRECPELGALLDGGDPPAAEEAAAAHGDPDEGLASERYRQLQAECVCRAESCCARWTRATATTRRARSAWRTSAAACVRGWGRPPTQGAASRRRAGRARAAAWLCSAAPRAGSSCSSLSWGAWRPPPRQGTGGGLGGGPGAGGAAARLVGGRPARRRERGGGAARAAGAARRGRGTGGAPGRGGPAAAG